MNGDEHRMNQKSFFWRVLSTCIFIIALTLLACSLMIYRFGLRGVMIGAIAGTGIVVLYLILELCIHAGQKRRAGATELLSEPIPQPELFWQPDTEPQPETVISTETELQPDSEPETVISTEARPQLEEDTEATGME